MADDVHKRPVWVWVISIFYLVSAAFTAFSFYLVLTHAIPLPPGQQAYMDSLRPVDFAVTGLILVCNLGGALSLFLLRRIAPLLFATGLAANLAQTGWHVMTKGWAEAIGSAGLTGFIAGTALSVAVLIYALHLRRRGVLR